MTEQMTTVLEEVLDISTLDSNGYMRKILELR